MRELRAVAWYRFRASLARRWGGLVAIVLLLGLTGGIALGAMAGARRTQSSYAKFLASTDPSDLTVSTFGADGAAVSSLKSTIARVPDVARVTSVEVPPFTLVTATGAPVSGATASVFMLASTDGEMFKQDRLTVVHGRMSDPTELNEVVVTPSAAAQLEVHVGSTMRLGLFATHTAPPVLRQTVTVVGIVEFNNQVIQDDIDAAFGFAVLTPALLERATAALPGAAAPTLYGLQLTGGSRDVPAVERALIRLIPSGSQYEFHVTAPVVAQVEDAIRPESIALGAFGAIALLVTLVLAAQAVSRQLRSGDDDRRVMRALGAGPTMTIADGLLAVLGAIALGSIVALMIAIAVSPFSPLGPVRTVYPTLGPAFDWTVLGAGFAVFVAVLTGVAIAISYRRAPHRIARDRGPQRQSNAARAAANSALPVPIATGMRFAFESDTGSASVPVRSTQIGTVIAVALVVATITFAAGLSHLVSHPSLYGWNWNYAISPSSEVPPVTRTLLTHDHDVAGWAGASEIIIEIDGQTVPALLTTPKAAVSPPILSGHGLDASNQVVLGAATLARLHARVGQDVTISYGSPADAPAYVAPERVKVVGTATLPAVGFASFVADHTSMGTGALVSTGLESPAFRKIQLNSDPNLNGPDLVFVRMRRGLSADAARVNLQHIVTATDRVFAADRNAAGNNVTVVGVQRPAQIVNFRSVGSAPVFLAIALALGAVVALSLTLVASVRRRRRDLALLKTLGFTRRQLAGVIASQSTIAVVIGIVIGIPIGIASGRALWDLFARAIDAVPQPTVPTATIVLVAACALVLANLVATLPALRAARTPIAALLHAE